MKRIRKIQNRVTLIHSCLNTDLTSCVHSGYVFCDRAMLDKSEDEGIYKYLVYLKDKGLIFSYKSQTQLNLETLYKFKIYLFMEEWKNKVKIDIV